MSTFSYGGSAFNFPGNSGLFINSTTATDGTGTQSNPCLLVYRATKKIKYYRDQVVFEALGRSKPAVEVGQYNFRGVDVTAAYPGTGTDYNGATVTRDVIEGRITSIVNALMTGSFVEYQDSRGRHLYGSFTTDPELEDQGVLWTSVTFSLVEAGA